MGSDASDFNNDGYTDLISLDMLGESHERRKTTISKSFFFQNVLNKKWGYQDQHMRNMLFKNNGSNLPFSKLDSFRAFIKQIGVGLHFLLILIMTGIEICLSQTAFKGYN